MVDENNYVVFTDHPDPPGETHMEKIRRGIEMMRQERKDDPGSGKLGLNIRMDGETMSIAHKEKDDK